MKYFLNHPSHGRTKTLVGGALYGLGALTFNPKLKLVGKKLVKAGIASKIAAHFLPNGR